VSFLRRHSIFALPLTLTALLCAFAFLTPARSNPILVWTFCGVAIGLLSWQLILLFQTARSDRRLTLEFLLVKTHYVQAVLHFGIFSYWGFFWRNVYAEAHLIAAQMIFLYVFDMLLCWSRRNHWRLSFGPIPIIFSTNLFLWFKDDWFFFQFLMIATGALGKELIRWQKNGKKVHIFNPSGFSLSVFSAILILTGTTDYTWGNEIAVSLYEPPHMYLVIFIVGLIVQYLFSVTLMTFSAAAALWILNLVYTQITGVYFFVDVGIPIAVFVGLHLLVTDPSTSPRTNVGRVIFGSLYGLSVAALYTLLELGGAPQFYDKLLCVPILNLSVQIIDRVARAGVLGRIGLWADARGAQKLNLLSMATWSVLFSIMLSTGFVGGGHPGESVEFWGQACEKKQRNACERLIRALDFQSAQGSSLASYQLAMHLLEGKITEQDPIAAGELFARSCDQGEMTVCGNLVNLYINNEIGSPEDVARAIGHLEASEFDENGRNRFFIGLAYVTGRGRPVDKNKALGLFHQSCDAGWLESCVGVARMRMEGDGVPVDLTEAAMALEKGSAGGDATSSFLLAELIYRGEGVGRDEPRAISLYRKSCEKGLPEACSQLEAIEK